MDEPTHTKNEDEEDAKIDDIREKKQNLHVESCPKEIQKEFKDDLD